jgi:hypothetical protein
VVVLSEHVGVPRQRPTIPDRLLGALRLTSAGLVRRVTRTEWHLRLVRANWSAVTKVGCYSVVIAETAIRSSA